MPLQQFDERVPYTNFQFFDDTYVPGTKVDTEVGNGLDIRYDLMQIVSQSLADIDFTLYIGSSGFQTPIGGITVPAGAGYTTLAVADILTKLFGGPGGFFILPNPLHLYTSLASAPSAGTLLTWFVRGGSF